MVTTVLPVGPIELDPATMKAERRQFMWLSLLLVGVGGAFLVCGAYFAHAKWLERQLWETGVESRDVSVSGDVRGSGKFGVAVFYDYDLQVTYLDAESTPHTVEAEFSTFWQGAPTEEAVTVRYDPADPRRIAVSSSIASGGWGWGLPSLLFALGVFISAGFVASARQRRTRLAVLRGACEERIEHVVSPLSLKDVPNTPNVAVDLELPSATGAIKKVTILQPTPMIVEANGRGFVLVVETPRQPGRHVLVSADFKPFLLDDAAKSSAFDRLHREALKAT